MEVLFPNTVAKETLKRGDHIFACRQGCEPLHGIYDGEGLVIYFISSLSDPSIVPCQQCGPNLNPQGITRRCLKCFLSGSSSSSEPYLFKYSVLPPFYLARVHGRTCTLASSDPPEVVMSRAELLLENGAVSTYGYFVNSFEDFAVYCKTGLLVVGGNTARTQQAATAVVAAATVASGSPFRSLLGFAGSAVLGVGLHCFTRLDEDIVVRRDVVKDAVSVPLDRVIHGSGI